MNHKLVWVLLAWLPGGAIAQVEVVGEQRNVLRPRASLVLNVMASEDGNRIAAVYFTPPVNRPGTDWHASVVIHDLETGERHTQDGLFGAMAFSPDGTRIVAEGYRQGHTAEGPGLWQVGEDEVRMLAIDGDKGTPVVRSWDIFRSNTSVAFTPDGKEVFVGKKDGRISVWSLDGEAEERIIHAHPDAGEPPRANGFHIHLQRAGDRMVAIVSHAGDEAPVMVTFRKERGGWEASGEIALEGRAGYLGLIAEPGITGSFSARNFGALSALMNGEPARVRSNAADYRLAVDAGGERYAMSAGRAVEVRDFSGEILCRLPTSHVWFFRDGGRQVVTSDANHGIQIWDLETGRMVDWPGRPPVMVRVAAVQAHSQFGDVVENQERLLRLVGRAARNGARIVVLPEASLTGYLGDGLRKRWLLPGEDPPPGVRGVDPADAALAVDSPMFRLFSRAARSHGIYLAVPFVEVDRGTGRYFNSVVVHDPDGARALHYRKHDAWEPGDGGWMRAGNLGHPVADTPFGRIGCLICYDIHDQAPAMADLGVDILLYSIAWVDEEGSGWFDENLPEIAERNGMDMVAANWAIPQGEEAVGWHGHGQSRVIARTGEVVMSTGVERGDRIVVADLPVRTGEPTSD